MAEHTAGASNPDKRHRDLQQPYHAGSGGRTQLPLRFSGRRRSPAALNSLIGKVIMPTAKPTQVIPPERIRGYAALAPEYAQYGVNIASHFCHSVIEGQIPYGMLSPELQARLTPDQLKMELASAFNQIGSWPCDYDFERIILVLCDDSVRKPVPDDFGWPADMPPNHRRVILEFAWHFPKPHKDLPCTFWTSVHNSYGMYVCKFLNEKVEL